MLRAIPLSLGRHATAVGCTHTAVFLGCIFKTLQQLILTSNLHTRLILHESYNNDVCVVYGLPRATACRILGSDTTLTDRRLLRQVSQAHV